MRIYREAGPQCPATWKEGRIVGLGKKQPTEGTDRSVLGECMLPALSSLSFLLMRRLPD